MRDVEGMTAGRLRPPTIDPRGRRAASGIPALLLAAALVGCGSDAPEERLAEARERLDEANEQVRGLEAEVEQKREAVRRAEQALARSRAELADAEGRLADARATIDERSTDVALFRAVQAALLEHDALEDFAIRVYVAQGAVTLRGIVDDPDQAEEAVATARAVTGVEEVVSEIEVRTARTG